ncbi:MAG: hypothetical protein JSV81_00250, partial [Anaerolineales bacterium]
LAALLQVAEMLRVPEGPPMSAEGFAAAQARMQAQAAGLRARRQRRLHSGRPGVWPYVLAITRRLTMATVAGILLLGVLLSAGAITVSAASTSLPGSQLYPIKRATESLVSSAAFTPRLQARVHLAWADRRLIELEALFARDGTVYRTVLGALERETERGLAAAEQADSEMLRAVASHTQRQQMVLGELLDQAPESSRSDLERALAAAVEANKRARSALDGQVFEVPTTTLAPPITLEPPSLADTLQPRESESTPTPAPQGTTGVAETSMPLLFPAATEAPATPQATPEPELLETPNSTPTSKPSVVATPSLATSSPGSPTATPTIEPSRPLAPTSTLTPTPVATEPGAPTPGPTSGVSRTPTATPTQEKVELPTAAPTMAPTQEPTSDVWDRSGLGFTGQGIDCEGEVTVWASVMNSGDRAMAGPTDWELWYALSGSPKLGQMVAREELPPLDTLQEYLLSKVPLEGAGNYAFKVYQRPGHPGGNDVWTDAIAFDPQLCGN